MPAPETGPAAVAGTVIDLRQVPRSADADPNQPHRFHLQGEFRQSQGKDLVRAPLVDVKHGNPASTPPDMADSTKASGDYVTGWDAQAFSGWVPPDEVFAVGVEYILEGVNSGFSVYTKAGRQTTGYTDYESFVNLPAPWDGFCYDPRMVYDTYSGKFVMTIMGRDDTNLKSYVWLMTSVTDDPNGSWYRWRFDFSRGGAGSEEWLDYSGLGVDNWGVYFTGNYFFFAGGFSNSVVWSLSRDYLGPSSGGSVYIWSDPNWPNGNAAFSIQPAHPHSTNSGGGSFFINTYSGNGTEVLLWTLVGKRYPNDPEPDAASLTNTAVTARQYYAMGMNINQPDNAVDLDGGDTRIMNAVYSQGKIYGTFGFDPDADSSNCEVYTFGLTTAGALSWDYTIWSDGLYYSYPSITIDGNGGGTPNWFAGFTYTSEANNVNPSSMAFVRNVGAATNSFTWDRGGAGDYVRYDSGGRNRWGDYSLAQYDNTCDNVWSVQEYATASNTWATRIFGRVINDEPACIYLHQHLPNGGESYTAGNSVSLQWDKLNLPASDDLWFKVQNEADSWWEWYGPFSTSLGSYSWSVPNRNGTYKMNVGSWDGATITTDDWSDSTFTINGLPDLDVTTFSGASSAGPGGSFSVTNEVTNIGPVTAIGTATTNIYLSTNATADIFDSIIGSRGITNLGAGSVSSTGTTVTIPGGATPGPYYICIWTDAGPIPSITEFNELNNGGCYAFTVTDTSSIFSDGFETGNTSSWSSTVN